MPQIAVGISLILLPFRSPDKAEPVRLESPQPHSKLAHLGEWGIKDPDLSVDASPNVTPVSMIDTGKTR